MKDTLKYLRNKIIAILTVLLFATGTLQAQVFIMDEDVEGVYEITGEEEYCLLYRNE